jgi:DNA-binding NarL/FixJ family response regulator
VSQPLDLTPEQLAAQHAAIRKLRVIREEGETFHFRRDEAIVDARKTGLSLRQIGNAVGLTGSSVKDHLDKLGIPYDPNVLDAE